MSFILFSLFSYFLGSINGAQFLHHVFRGRYPKHISRAGTRNLGAQNVWMSIGRTTGLVVFLVDFLKGFFVIFIGRLIGFEGAVLIIFGAFAIAGHNWPVFFHFRGGRGFAALIGILYAFNPLAGIVASLVSVPFAVARFAGITPFIFLVVCAMIAYAEFGFEIIAAYIFVAIVLYAKRMYAEWRALKKSKNKGRVLINLLVYDRATSNPPSLKELFS